MRYGRYPACYNLMALAVVLLTLATTVMAERRTALVVGNAAYENGSLQNPVNDASDIAAALRQLGFEVTLLRDVDLRTMREAIDTFSQQLRQGGVGLFYFAGHGVQASGENYLLPLGMHIRREQDLPYEAVAVGRVLVGMEDANNQLNIIILDACRDNPFARSWRSSQRGLAPAQVAPGTLIAYATSPGGVAHDGHGRNGAYTAQLLRHLMTPGLSVEQLFKRVRAAIVETTRGEQTPWESSSLIRDFAFAVLPTSPPPPSIARAPAGPQHTGDQQRRATEQEPPGVQSTLGGISATGQDITTAVQPLQAECPPEESSTLGTLVPLYSQWQRFRHTQWQDDEVMDPILEAMATEEAGKEGTARGRGPVFRHLLAVLEAADPPKAALVMSGFPARVVLEELRAGAVGRAGDVARLATNVGPYLPCVRKHRHAMEYLTTLIQMPPFPDPIVDPTGEIGKFIGAYMRKHILVDHHAMTQSMVVAARHAHTAMQPSAQRSSAKTASLALLEKALEKLAPKTAAQLRKDLEHKAPKDALDSRAELQKRQAKAIKEYADAYKILSTADQTALIALAPPPVSPTGTHPSPLRPGLRSPGARATAPPPTRRATPPGPLQAAHPPVASSNTRAYAGGWYLR